MKLKHCRKYIGFIIIISCVALSSISLTYNDNYKNEDKPTRIIIKSPEEGKSNFENRGSTNSDRVKVSVPPTNAGSQAQPIPVPDKNSSIIVSPL